MLHMEELFISNLQLLTALYLQQEDRHRQAKKLPVNFLVQKKDLFCYYVIQISQLLTVSLHSNSVPRFLQFAINESL